MDGCGGVETPEECMKLLEEAERITGRRYSMYRCQSGCFHDLDDGGKVRDISCATKRLYESKAQAKKSQKRLAGQGRRGLLIYECWYGDHWHLGHPPGAQTYRRSGRVYG